MQDRHIISFEAILPTFPQMALIERHKTFKTSRACKIYSCINASPRMDWVTRQTLVRQTVFLTRTQKLKGTINTIQNALYTISKGKLIFSGHVVQLPPEIHPLLRRGDSVDSAPYIFRPGDASDAFVLHTYINI